MQHSLERGLASVLYSSNYPERTTPLSTLSKRIEVIANVAIIVVALLIVGVIVQRFFLARRAAPPTITVGSKVGLAGVDWQQNHRTLVLALQRGCRYCAQSASFYQRLTQVAPTKGVKLVAVLPQPPAEGHEYLSSLAVSITDIRQSPLDGLNVSGTPTLILVDDKGLVVASWVGKLPSDKEAEVLAQLN